MKSIVFHTRVEPNESTVQNIVTKSVNMKYEYWDEHGIYE